MISSGLLVTESEVLLSTPRFLQIPSWFGELFQKIVLSSPCIRSKVIFNCLFLNGEKACRAVHTGEIAASFLVFA